MDALSQVLRSFRLGGSFYAAWELGAPWGLSFRAQRGAPFHYVEAGAMWLVSAKGETLHVEAGDVVVLFDGGGHRVGDRPETPAERIESVLAGLPQGTAHRWGGRGRRRWGRAVSHGASSRARMNDLHGLELVRTVAAPKVTHLKLARR